MPVIVPDGLPAVAILQEENIHLIEKSKYNQGDAPELRIAVLNLMPTKILTEVQLLRLLNNTPLMIEITFFHPETYRSKNISIEHLNTFYSTFSKLQNHKYDGLIVTGAPVERLDFEKVSYWAELKDILNWAFESTYSIYSICWGAQATLNHFYGIPKYILPQKMFGCFEHSIRDTSIPIIKNFSQPYWAPHSRHTEIKAKDILANNKLVLVSDSAIAGVCLVTSKDGKVVMCTGHSEYDRYTLGEEYFRDVNRGLPIEIPVNYFPDNNPQKTPKIRWGLHANLLYQNWINYYVFEKKNNN